jgi:hypothetical protein
MSAIQETQSADLMTKLDQGYATYKDYTSVRLSNTQPEQKIIPGTGPQATPPTPAQHYYIVPSLYNFGTSSNKVLNDFMLEGPEMTTSFGIQSKQSPSGRMEHSIMCKFDMTNTEQLAFINTFDDIHKGFAGILAQIKGAVKLYNFNPQMAEATGLKNPIYKSRDELTGEVIQGRPPSIFLKLFSRGKGAMAEQTLFTGIDGNNISWNLLQNVEMKFIPLLHIKRMYVGGGKASIQIELVSAIVTSIHARNTTTRQLSTIHRIQTQRPELVDNVSAQIAKLTLERQDQIFNQSETQQQQQQTHPSTPTQSTFSGIEPPSQKSISISSIPDFTAYTPQRNVDASSNMQLN